MNITRYCPLGKADTEISHLIKMNFYSIEASWSKYLKQYIRHAQTRWWTPGCPVSWRSPWWHVMTDRRPARTAAPTVTAGPLNQLT